MGNDGKGYVIEAVNWGQVNLSNADPGLVANLNGFNYFRVGRKTNEDVFMLCKYMASFNWAMRLNLASMNTTTRFFGRIVLCCCSTTL